jgi:pilus assembly protein CpaB
MKRAQLLGIGIAAISGLGAFIGMKSLVYSPNTIIQKETVDSTDVLVAQSAIGLGSSATAANFRWQAWPKSAVTPAYIRREGRPNAIKELSGSIARSPILSGEPITDTKLISAGNGGVLAAILPPGKRAISTRITDQSAVGKMILPNDRVDVILTQRKRGNGEQHISETLFRNVRVLAIGNQLEAKQDQKNAEGNVATLELTARQAETLALANSMGEISLALRSIADRDTDKNEDVAENPDESRSISILRYGVKQSAYGVN